MLLHHKFIQIAKKNGEKLAIIDRSVNKRISYAKALIASLILSKKFDQYDEGFIGIMLPTSAGAVLSILGALMSGRTPVMINYSTGAEKNARFAQRKCNFKTIITAQALLEKINCPEIPGMVFLEDMMTSINPAQKIWAAIKSKLPFSLLKRIVFNGDAKSLSVILFTSGSEKDPKAVPLTHHNILCNIQGFSDSLDLSERERVLAILPYFHVFGLNTNLWTPLFHGMTLITYANPLEYKTIATIVREEQADMMVGTPSFFWGYVQKSEPGDFTSIKIAVVGADKCPETLRKAFKEKHNVLLLEGYGATETSPVISTNTPANNRPGSVGKPLSNIKVRIENYETGKECKPLEIGKILVKGDSIMPGYFDDLEETSVRVRSGWYDTGDMGCLDGAGYLWHAGRLKRFVKIGGEMISLVAVEEALGKVLPDGAECCVVEIPDALKGAKILAAVTHPVNKKEIIATLAKDLANIAIPKQFIIMEDLPKMGSGKIDFRTTTEMVRNMLVEKTASFS